jgi:hypothetical protein
VPVLVRGGIAVAGAVAALAASGCGGGTATTVSKAVTTDASTTTSSTIGVPTHVFVMNSGGQRLVEPSEFTFNVEGAVVGDHLHWTNWGEPAATAEGLFSERRFSSSNRVHFRSTLKLTKLRVCKGAEYYTHAAVSPLKPHQAQRQAPSDALRVRLMLRGGRDLVLRVGP